MAALLVAMSIGAILMTAAMPTWRQTVRREREAELVFRGEQYARAIGLFQKKSGPGVLPQNIDILVEQKFLRRAYKDPITNSDFELLRTTAGRGGPGVPGQGAAPGRGGAPPASPNQPASPGIGTPGANTAGGITGVASKSKDESIRIYKGATHYNEWQFVFVPQQQAAGPQGGDGRGQGGTQGPGQGRGRGGQDGGRGPQGFDRRGPVTGPPPSRGFGPSNAQPQFGTPPPSLPR